MTDPWGGDIEAWAKSLGPADLEASDWRKRLCRALTLPPDTSWTEVVQAARDAGLVRDAEYRASDRVFEENKRLRAERDAYRDTLKQLAAAVDDVRPHRMLHPVTPATWKVLAGSLEDALGHAFTVLQRYEAL